MFGSSILDVAIGMAFVYLLLSLIASGIQEGIAAVAQTRASNLLQGLQSLFSGDNTLLKKFYDHGLIRGLYRDLTEDQGKIKATRTFDWFRRAVQWSIGMAPAASAKVVANPLLLPAYIPSRTFALTLVDILDPAANGSPVTLERLRTTLATAFAAEPDNKALQAISALADSAGDDLKVFQARLEDWYNDSMNRISGWYKKHTQNILLVIGLVLAVAFNVNSIRVAETLWTNKDAREAMVDAAKQYVTAKKAAAEQQSDPSGAGKPTADQTRSADAVWSGLESDIGQFQTIENKKLMPLGWNGGLYAPEDGTREIARKSLLALIGWLITALALSLGASFWFDTLNKFMVIRGTVKPDEKSRPEHSKD